ncbi:MAG: universal stress protein, partial [Nocardioidaceae bacterium]
MSISNEIDLAGGILVGHDGSDFSDHALGWAMRLAAGLGSEVTVARAWVLTTAPRPDSWSPGYMPPLEDFEAATLAALERDVRAARESHPDVT